MKIKIEIRPDEVDMAIRNYIRQSGMAIADDGDLNYIRSFTPDRPEMTATYEVEIE